MTVRSLLFDRKREHREVELTARVVATLGRDRLLWVDVCDATASAQADIDDLLGVPRELRRPAGASDRPALRRHQGWVRIEIIAIQAPVEGNATTPPEAHRLEIFAGENVVVSRHDRRLDAIDTLTDLLRDEPGLGALDAAVLFSALVDEVLTLFRRHSDAIERRIDGLDEMAIRGRTVDGYLGEVVVLRRRIAGLRWALAANREALGPLARPDFDTAASGRPWPGIVDRLESTIQVVETVRELLIGSIALRQSGSAERTNEVMKRLTLLNAVLLPSVVLAGLMGMNFKLAFFDDPGNFRLVAGLMIGMAAATLVIARLRRWV